MLAAVLLDIPSQAIESLFTYTVPKEMRSVQVGCAVVVPFGNRLAIGFVMALGEEPLWCDIASLDRSKLKPIQQVASKPYFDENGAACAMHLAESCVAPLSSCIRLFTPPGGVPSMVRGEDGWHLREPEIGEVDDRFVRLTESGRSFVPRKGAVRQQSIIDALRAGELRVSELSFEFGPVASSISALEKKGAVVVEHRRRLRGIPEVGESEEESRKRTDEKVALTRGQQEALDAIGEAIASGEGRTILLDGVTGSGKTEVYLRAIEPLIDKGKTAIVLVPEISLTPQTVSRFRGRFGDRVAVMHSRMSRGERYDQWDYIRSGKARVVVGARSALFTPVRDVGIIVIDEEHEGSYKQDQAPRYHARDVALWMAKRMGATLVLGSATPSIETLYACAKRDDFTSVALPERANGKPLPEVEVVDMASEFRDGSRSMFSRRLADKLQQVLQREEKAILLLNQRGFAQFLLCRDCGFVPECPQCATSLTYHEFEGCLQCHHCGILQPIPARCPQCGSPYLKRFGAGTQRVEAELREMIASFEGVDARVTRMDADTTRKKGAHRKLLEEFMAPGPAVLLGTQMIAKGLDFADVTLVGVVNADTMLKLPDFRSAERTYDLVEQVAGRAGRADLPGVVVVQTYWAESAAIRAAALHARSVFLKDELPKRRALGYPPYVRMANVLVWGKDEQGVKRDANRLYRAIYEEVRGQKVQGWIVLPATPCALSKLRNTYRWHIVVKAPIGEDLAGLIGPCLKRRNASPGVSAAVDIDPLSLV